MHQSVATIDSPEFLNLQPLDINPLMSKCEIKVFYIGANRNQTFITEEVATEIGKTLRGAPIVGYFRESKEDFTDHGEKVIIDDEGIHFECQTVPYGFVSPDADVWFQNFEDHDEFGNVVVHKYLMTTGYLWTDQFPESSLPVKQGRPQSMELKGDSVQGRWETNSANGLDFFIINDAIIQKICILGEDVEPCFEGASVTAPDVSSKFTLDDRFKNTLYSMMQDLKNVLEKGGQYMKDLDNTAEVAIEETEAAVEYTEDAAIEQVEDNSETEVVEEDTSASTEYTEEDAEAAVEDVTEPEVEEVTEEPAAEENKYQLLEEECQNLEAKVQEWQDKYTALETQYQELVNFKNEIDNQRKDALISEFYMLSDEDKAEVIENKEKYTLDEIKAKLSVICFDKKINFTLDNEQEETEEDQVFTYTLEEDRNLPDWVRAVKETEKEIN